MSINTFESPQRVLAFYQVLTMSGARVQEAPRCGLFLRSESPKPINIFSIRFRLQDSLPFLASSTQGSWEDASADGMRSIEMGMHCEKGTFFLKCTNKGHSYNLCGNANKEGSLLIQEMCSLKGRNSISLSQHKVAFCPLSNWLQSQFASTEQETGICNVVVKEASKSFV